MKDQYAITISDYSGAKHYFLKKSIKKKLIYTGSCILSVVLVSFVANYAQIKTNSGLVQENSRLSNDLLEYDRLNSSLDQIIASHTTQISSISKELVEIERLSGVETADLDVSLEERIKSLGQFYNSKEEEYSEIGSRVEHIEDIIGMDEESQEEFDLATRVELASLTASQERILHDSIPSGYPTDRKKITSSFGMRKHPVTKINSFHKGVDIRAKSGEPIYATADGFISHSEFSELSGNRIVIVHNFGFETRYGHLKEMLVTPGEMVNKGDLVGFSGNTGRSAAPHLHYEIRYLGKAINPYEFLNWEFGTNDIFTQVRGIQWPSLISLINKQITHQTLQLSLLDRTSLEK